MPKLDGDVARVKDFRAILDRKDIDAVVIASPDHWHAIQTITACKAGQGCLRREALVGDDRRRPGDGRRGPQVRANRPGRHPSAVFADVRPACRDRAFRGDRQGHGGPGSLHEQHESRRASVMRPSPIRRPGSTGTCGWARDRLGRFSRRSCRTSFAGGIFIRRKWPTGASTIST